MNLYWHILENHQEEYTAQQHLTVSIHLNYNYRKQHFEAMDGILTQINTGFQQKRAVSIAAALEKLALCAIQNDTQSEDLPDELNLYEKDMDILQLSAQLPMLPDLQLAYNNKNPRTVI